MKILFTKQRPLSYPGGETSHLFGIANVMRKLGVEIFMMPASKEPTSPLLWPAEYVRDVRPSGLHRLLDSFVLSRAVANFLLEIPVDTILSWEYETAYLRNFQRDKKFVLGVIAGAPFGFLREKANRSPVRAIAYHLFQFRQLRCADIIFAPSQYAKNQLVEKFDINPDKIVISLLAADEIFQPLNRLDSPRIKTIIFSGSLERIKGIFDALDALGRVSKQGVRDWVLKVAGWGDIQSVKNAAKQAGIADQVYFLGQLERSKLAQELSMADFALLPSHVETFGLSIIEAQASGLPVVSYATASIPEIVVHGQTGLLVPLFDRSALSQAVLELLINPERARNMGRLAAMHVRSNFSWEQTACVMLDYLQNLRSSYT